jgi:hypothetical protein
VYFGNPGTGKTSVARVMAKIFNALNLLESGHLVETDRAGLVAGYVGQTAIKVADVVNKALGGVLFIDEAYSLSSQRSDRADFGQEAIATLLVDSDAKCNPVDSIGSSMKKSGFPVRTPAFCSVSRGPSRLGEKEYRAPSMTPGVALRPRTQD